MKRRISVEGEQGDSGGRMGKGEAMQGCDVLSQAACLCKSGRSFETLPSP